MSLLRMYLEPSGEEGKDFKPNVAVALNLLQEHRQKIAIAKVLPRVLNFGGMVDMAKGKAFSCRIFRQTSSKESLTLNAVNCLVKT